MTKTKKQILIVEDDTSTREALSNKLKEGGFEVLVARNGQECLDILEKEIPDLTLLDMVMPIMDGPHVIKEVQKNEKLNKMPIVILTNVDSNQELAEIIENKTYDYLLKVDHTLESIVEFVKTKLEG